MTPGELTMPDPDPKLPINMPDTFEEAERFQRLFVLPVADAVRVEVRNALSPLTDRVQTVEAKVKSYEDRVTALEAAKTKALVGYGVFATGLSIAMSYAWTWISKRIGL